MAVTNYGQNVAGSPVKTVRLTADADNDVLLPSTSNYIVLSAFFHGAHLSALNLDSGADITAYPFTTSGNDVCATSDATAGDVTIAYIQIPDVGPTTFTS